MDEINDEMLIDFLTLLCIGVSKINFLSITLKVHT